MAYDGSVEIISGLKPKNGANFPLIDAEHVFVSDGVNLGQMVSGIAEEGKSIKELIESKTETATTAAETFGARIEALEESVGGTSEVGSMIKMTNDPAHHIVIEDNDGDTMFYIDSDGNGQFPGGVYSPNIDKLAGMVGSEPVKDQINDAIRREQSARGDDVNALTKRCTKIESTIDTMKLADYRLSGTWATMYVDVLDDDGNPTGRSKQVDDYRRMYISTPNYPSFAYVDTRDANAGLVDEDNNPLPQDMKRKLHFSCDVEVKTVDIMTLADKVAFLLNKTGYTYTEDWNA